MINYLGTFPLVVPILEISVMQGQVLPEERAAGGRDFNHGRARAGRESTLLLNGLNVTGAKRRDHGDG